MKFNEKLIELRKKEGLSQEELGYKLNVTRQTVSKWELGQTTPEMDKLVEMSKIFNTSIDELINESEVTSSQKTVIDDQPIAKEGNREKNVRNIIIVTFIVVIVLIAVKLFNTDFSIPNKIFNQVDKAIDKHEDISNQASNIINQAIDNATDEQKDISNQSSDIENKANEIINSVIDEQKDVSNSISQSTEVYNETKNKVTIGQFNGSIEIFNGTNNGMSVKNVLDKIITINKTKDRKITVKYKETETQDESEIKNLKQKMNTFDNYEVTFEYDTEGFINKAIIEKI